MYTKIDYLDVDYMYIHYKYIHYMKSIKSYRRDANMYYISHDIYTYDAFRFRVY